MNISSRTPDGWPCVCPTCGRAVVVAPSRFPLLDAPCPHCGVLILFSPSSCQQAFSIKSGHCESMALKPKWTPTNWKVAASFFVIYVSSLFLLFTGTAFGDSTSRWDTWSSWCFVIVCAMSFLLGVVVCAFGMSSRREFYLFMRLVDHGHIPKDFARYLRKEDHRSLITIGTAVAVPALCLVVLAVLGR